MACRVLGIGISVPANAAARGMRGLRMVQLWGIRVASVAVLAGVFTASGALCQQAEQRASNPLPEAPTAQDSTSPESFKTTYLKANFPSPYPAVHLQELQRGNTDRNLRNSWLASYKWMAAYKEEPKDTNDFRKELTALLQHNVSYRPTANGSVKERATFAALGTFVTRSPSGKTRLNSSYLLGVLTSAVVHTAYRPYWKRPLSAPFSDFGSTVGNDAGMNLLHEFRPGLEQLMKSHTPKFVSRIGESIGRK